jgi:hypothetical protein
MKKILIAILLLLIPVDAFALSAAVQAVCGASSVPAACETVQTPTETGATTATFTNDNTANRYYGTRFIAESTDTICAIDVYLYKAGTPSDTMTITVHIYSDAFDETTHLPNTSLGSSSVTIYAKDLTTEEAAYKFTGLSVDLTNETHYWVVVVSNEYDASNYFLWTAESGGTTENLAKWNGSSWSTASTARTAKYVLYK